MTRYQPFAIFLLRIATAANFLSAVAGRLGFWDGSPMHTAWQGFVQYTGQVNSFAPTSIVPFLAVAATTVEVILALLLITGYKTRWAALAGAILTFIFFVSMSISFGMQQPMNYSVLVDCTSALLLATMPAYRWSVDEKLAQKNIAYAG